MKKVVVLVLIIFPFLLFSQNTLINDFILHQLNTKFDKIDTNNIDLAAVNDISLDEIEVKLNEINYRINTDKFGHENKNNSIILFQLDLLQTRTNKLCKVIDRQVATLDKLYYNIASLFCMTIQTKRMLRNILKSHWKLILFIFPHY